MSYIHKEIFRYDLCIRNGWTPPRLPTHCSCGQVLSVNHAFCCPKGAFPSIRHNNIRDTVAQFLTAVLGKLLSRNCTSSSAACYRKHEKEKRREYERRVIIVEHGTFCPLVLSTRGGWGPSA